MKSCSCQIIGTLRLNRKSFSVFPQWKLRLHWSPYFRKRQPIQALCNKKRQDPTLIIMTRHIFQTKRHIIHTTTLLVFTLIPNNYPGNGRDGLIGPPMPQNHAQDDKKGAIKAAEARMPGCTARSLPLPIISWHRFHKVAKTHTHVRLQPVFIRHVQGCFISLFIFPCCRSICPSPQ